MSLDRIEGAIDGARSRFQAALGERTLSFARELAAQAQEGRVAPGDPPAELVDGLHQELVRLYGIGRETVREELHAQMAHPNGDYRALDSVHRDDPNASTLDRLRARAQAAADGIRSAITAALAKASLHKGSGAATLQLAAEQAAQAGLKAAAQDHAAAALNAGRIDQADTDSDLIAGTYYTSILDANRCRDCAQADDDVLRPLDDPVRLAHMPPNPGCFGGGRCRCMEAYIMKSEAPASA
jgi:hypothetical protein